MNVLRQLWILLEDDPLVSYKNIPQTAIHLLNKMETKHFLNKVTLTRMSSFRNSLRKFSFLSNKMSPNAPNVDNININPRRSVTFNDQPKIYCIYK